jgi:hypothetical protein
MPVIKKKKCWQGFAGNWTSSLVKLFRLRRPNITCSPSYAEYRPKTNAEILDMGHTLRGEHAQEEQGKGRKLKTCMWFMCSL